MSNSVNHFLTTCIRKARFTLELEFRSTTDSTLTDPTSPDTEYSVDGGVNWSDCAEEVTTGGSSGLCMITLTGAETDNKSLVVRGKSSNCFVATATIVPYNGPQVSTGTLSAGSSGGGTLGTILPYDITGCWIKTTGGTGGGGTGGASNQARRILTYNTSTGAFTCDSWETTPSTDTTYEIILPEGMTLGMLQAINPATPGRKPVVDSAGLVDSNMVKAGPTGSGTAQTAGDIYGILTNGTHGLAALKSLIDTLTGYVDTEVAAILAAVDTEIAAIKAKTDNLPSDPADASDIASSFSSISSQISALTLLNQSDVRSAVGLASANLDTQLSGIQTTANTIVGYLDTEIAAILAAVDIEVAAIKAKTDNLPSDPADQSAVEAAITAAAGSVTLAASQPSYAPLKASDYKTPVAATGTVSAVVSQLEIRTTLTQADSYWLDHPLRFTTGNNVGAVRPIIAYDNANGTLYFTNGDGFPSTIQVGDTFEILYDHIHSIADIASSSAQAVLEDTNTWPSNSIGGRVATAASVYGLVDAEVAAILAAVDTEVAAIKAKTDNLPSDPADQSAVEAAISALFTTPMAWSARATNAMPTRDELLLEVLGGVLMHRIVGLTKTLLKPDGTDSTKSYEFNASPPTSIEELT